jgi:hypothetical protein
MLPEVEHYRPIYKNVRDRTAIKEQPVIQKNITQENGEQCDEFEYIVKMSEDYI